VVTIIQLDFLVLVSEGGGADIVVVVTNNSWCLKQQNFWEALCS
jgi:hypothetical protein